MKYFTLFAFFIPLLVFSDNNKDKAAQVLNSSLRGNGMGFTENKGQIIDMGRHLRPDILFKGEGGGADIYLRKTGISYVYSDLNALIDLLR